MLVLAAGKGVRRCRAGVTGWAVWKLPAGLRWYVLGVIAAAAAATGTAAALTSWQARDVVLFGALAVFGAVVLEVTRRTDEPSGLIKVVHGAWQLPMALLLPPVYCLLAPVITFSLLQARARRTYAYRRAFSSAADGLGLGAASVAFHALPVAPGRPLLWLPAATGCALLWAVVHKTLVMTAIWASDRTVSIREQQFTRESLLTDACEIAAAVVIAGIVTWAPLPLLIPALPLVVVLHRSFRHAQLLGEARVDAKTGLLHAGAWRAEAEVQLARAQRTGSPVALGIADLDQLQAVNASHGWLAGEAVITTFAAMLGVSLRSSDLTGRLGGEEFVFLLPATTASEAVQVAARLRGNLAAQPIAAARGRDPLHVTVSIGIAATDEPAARDLADLLAAADAALRQAKESGRNAVALAPGSATIPEEAASGETLAAADPIGDREEIAAARRALGRELAAWRQQAGLSQRDLARRTNYSRSAISEAERGKPRSGDLWAAVDRATGAGGRLVARHAEIEAAATAARQRAGHEAWKARIKAANPGLADAAAQDGAATVSNSACPHCGKPIVLATNVTTAVIGMLSGADPAGHQAG